MDIIYAYQITKYFFLLCIMWSLFRGCYKKPFVIYSLEQLNYAGKISFEIKLRAFQKACLIAARPDAISLLKIKPKLLSTSKEIRKKL